MDDVAKKFFPVVVPGRENSEVIFDSVKIDLLRKSVVLALKRIETEDLGHCWWEDGELMKIFGDLYKAGVIFLPSDPVDRLRWIALLCIEICVVEEFSWGNVLVPMDYLPYDKFELFEDRYSINVFVEILKIRERLDGVGWHMVFGW